MSYSSCLVITCYHVMQFRNFYLVFLSVSQCQGIAPCYATLELIEFLEITVMWRDVTDIVSSRDPPDLKTYLLDPVSHGIRCYSGISKTKKYLINLPNKFSFYLIYNIEPGNPWKCHIKDNCYVHTMWNQSFKMSSFFFNS